MVKMRVGDELVSTPLRVRIRLDYKGMTKPGRFLFGGKSTEQAAEEMRDQQVSLLRNVPIQGLNIEDITMGTDLYTVFDELLGTEIAFAPVTLVVSADSFDDVLRFIAREEFRTIEILEPDHVYLSRYDMERLLFRMNDEIKKYRLFLERKYNSR